MKIKFLLLLLLIPAIIIPVFAIPAGTAFEPFCQKKTNDTRTTGADFICELDIFEMNNRITALEAKNTELESYITALTLLHYPVETQPPILFPTPTPIQPPVIGPTPELAPDAPTLKVARVSGPDRLQIQFLTNFDILQQPRGTVPPTFVVEWSDDGINWESKEADLGRSISIGGLTPFTEYLVKMKATNPFGDSNYTVIDSAIPLNSIYGDAEAGYIDNVEFSTDNSQITFRWNAAGITFGFDRVSSLIERSVNYGSFEEFTTVGSEQNGRLTDSDVIDGNIYSYRIQTTTTNEVQPRSGFTSILYTLD